MHVHSFRAHSPVQLKSIEGHVCIQNKNMKQAKAITKKQKQMHCLQMEITEAVRTHKVLLICCTDWCIDYCDRPSSCTASRLLQENHCCNPSGVQLEAYYVRRLRPIKRHGAADKAAVLTRVWPSLQFSSSVREEAGAEQCLLFCCKTACFILNEVSQQLLRRAVALKAC